MFVPTGRVDNSICVDTETLEHWRQEDIESKSQKLAESVKRGFDCPRM